MCLRCSWSLGGVQDRYFRYEAAGDQLHGRVVAGLPPNSAQFAVLPPHFQDNKNSVVKEGVSCMFQALNEDSSLQPILKLCLVSLVFHYDYLASLLPAAHSLRNTSIFRVNSMLCRLKEQLVQTDLSWMTVTGIPPQVVMFELLQQIHVNVFASRVASGPPH